MIGHPYETSMDLLTRYGVPNELLNRDVPQPDKRVVKEGEKP